MHDPSRSYQDARTWEVMTFEAETLGTILSITCFIQMNASMHNKQKGLVIVTWSAGLPRGTIKHPRMPTQTA